MNERIDPKLLEVLERQAVQVTFPQAGMLRLDAVPVGAGHSKPRTNLLFCMAPDEARWRAFVDEDLEPAGVQPARAALFGGERVEGWRELVPPQPLLGDVNEVMFRVLTCLDSPVCRQVRLAPRPASSAPVQELDPLMRRVARYVDPAELAARSVEPTGAQAELVARIPEIVCRRAAPACAVICGESGSGKSTVAVMAARALLERGVVRSVLEISGAAVSAGAIFWQQRDERLRQTLETAHSLGETLILWEHFDLAVGHSETARTLMTDALDRGLRVIGVARAEFSPEQWAEATALLRRVELLALDEPEAAEIRQMLVDRLRRHTAAHKLEVAPEVVPAVMMMAHLRPGANPGAAAGLLEAVLAHADWTQSALASPDDLYYLVPHAKP